MIIFMKSGCPPQEIELLFTDLCRWSIVPEVSVGKHKVAIILVGDTTEIDVQQVQNLSPFIEQVLRINKPFKRASLEFRYGTPSSVQSLKSNDTANCNFSTRGYAKVRYR